MSSWGDFVPVFSDGVLTAPQLRPSQVGPPEPCLRRQRHRFFRSATHPLSSPPSSLMITIQECPWIPKRSLAYDHSDRTLRLSTLGLLIPHAYQSLHLTSRLYNYPAIHCTPCYSYSQNYYFAVFSIVDDSDGKRILYCYHRFDSQAWPKPPYSEPAVSALATLPRSLWSYLSGVFPIRRSTILSPPDHHQFFELSHTPVALPDILSPLLYPATACHGCATETNGGASNCAPGSQEVPSSLTRHII